MAKVNLAVILAAGAGVRIQDHIQRMPKGFIELDGKSIIRRSLDRLLEAGVTRIIAVTGYRADFYEELRADYPMLETVHNEVYAASGSMYSFFLARELIDEDFLLLESDIVYERRALTTLQKTDLENAILISGRTDSNDEVYVDGENGRIRGISKNLNEIRTRAGELTGLSRINLKLYREMNVRAEKDFQETLKQEYDTNTLTGVAQDLRVNYILIEDLAWTEIDNPLHLKRAHELIFPRILEHDRIFS